jgi:formimidoylglutamase
MGFKWSLISVPDHLGVENVGGRTGAAFGPRAFWEIFSRMNGHQPGETPPLAGMKAHIQVPVGPDIAENHELAAQAVAQATEKTVRTVVIGGGHDHGYSHLLGIRRALGKDAKIGCINIDAHLDLRAPAPQISSGSPFFLAIENGVIEPEHLIEFGIQSHCNAPALWEYAASKGVEIVQFDTCRHSKTIEYFTRSLEKLARQVDAIVISWDLDSAAESFAPGVSAPQAEGFDSSEIVELCEIAGRNKKVISLGVFELNPLHDIGGRTARLAATGVFHFLEKNRDILF